MLPNGNFLVMDPSFDLTSPVVANVGAVYLYSPDGVLISSLRGSQANDSVGSSSVRVLENGNFVVLSPAWDNGGLINAGAVTWGHAATGFPGQHAVVSAANSLVGSSAADQSGGYIVAPLRNGNYVVCNPEWDNGAAVNAGAATLCDGTGGTTGPVTAANSLVGSQTNDRVGSGGCIPLANGNCVVLSGDWKNGVAANAGAVTWADGLQGVVGLVSTSNSLVGSQAGDRVGDGGIVLLPNGAYVVRSVSWDLGGITDVGAVTWCSGTTVVSGVVSAANSLVGSHTNDRVGSGLVTVLANGNYVVVSPQWDDGAVANVGAATWANGSTGIVGAISAGNSLIGSQANDEVAGGGVTALTNGHYVVGSPGWNNGAVVNAGAATWGNGGAGITGLVTTDNSLVGTSANDQVGSVPVALANGNYVVKSPDWDNGATADVGAVTWCNGAASTHAFVGVNNSLVGSTTGDNVGSQVEPLTQGNYVVSSANWDNGTQTDAGAVTWCDGRRITRGVVSSANSLVGSTQDDRVGNRIKALTNGNYITATDSWANGGIPDAGAVTWGDGRRGVKGTVSAGNSLVGTTANDFVSGDAIEVLNNGHYVVVSSDWDNGGITNAGAVTWCNGFLGARGPISATNSVVGTTVGDAMSTGDFYDDDHFVILSGNWDLPVPPTANVGVRMLVDGAVGVVGPVSRGLSIVGDFAGESMVYEYDAVHQRLLLGRQLQNMVTIIGNLVGPVLAKSGVATPGAASLGFGAPGSVAVGAGGSTLLDAALTGVGANGGRNRALFGLPSRESSLGLVMQLRDGLVDLGGGLPADAQATAFTGLVTQQIGRGLFQATAKGSGLNALNNRLLMADNGLGVWLVRRTGQALPELGGAALSGFREVLQHPTLDVIPVSYQLAPSQTAGVSSGTDTGVLVLKHSGTVSGVGSLAREGQPAFGGGVFGQFTGRAAVSFGSDVIGFSAVARQGTLNLPAVFTMKADGTLPTQVAKAGNAAPGAAPGTFSSFSGVGMSSGVALYKGLIKGVPATANEALWRGANLVFREGESLTGQPTVMISAIVRFWPGWNDQVIAQVKLKGAGVNATNNQALLLKQSDGQHLVLARTGGSMDGIDTATLGSIVTVDVNPGEGRYALVGVLRGAANNRNLALWTGSTSQGNDTTQQALRLPILRLRKGEVYSTAQTPLDTIRSLNIKPALDASGAGARGMAQAMGTNGDVAVFITGDRNVTELVLLPPNLPRSFSRCRCIVADCYFSKRVKRSASK
ncbi:MAG: hypothetical protein KDK97_00540 [Verrucomicrobiales bacterium]|nr:hypothetical protein [Verrucomicrobiales bacterium]